MEVAPDAQCRRADVLCSVYFVCSVLVGVGERGTKTSQRFGFMELSPVPMIVSWVLCQ